MAEILFSSNYKSFLLKGDNNYQKYIYYNVYSNWTSKMSKYYINGAVQSET